MKRLIDKIHARLGDLWWYAVLMFAAQRLGDAVNMVMGLYLVPRYVPMSELGAILPITMFVGVIGLPFSIASIPFLKFITLFNDRGEIGKVKAMVRDAFMVTISLGVSAFLISYFVCPLFFERMHVAQGSLGALMLAVALTNALGQLFGNTSAGMKCHHITVGLFAFAAPLRLLLFVVLAPFRALSGYVASQAAPSLTSIGATCWIMRTRLGAGVKCVPYWREHGRDILMYTLPFAVWTIACTISANVDMLVVRHRLREFESAGYYMLTRFSDIAAYISMAFSAFLFPITASMKAKNRESMRILAQAVLATLGIGAALSCIFAFTARPLLGSMALWREYLPLAGHLPWLTLSTTLGTAANCLVTYETAQGRFRFLWYMIPTMAGKAIFIYLATGYSFFADMLPQRTIDAIAALKPDSLTFVVAVFIAFNATQLVLMAVDVLSPAQTKSGRSRRR